MDRLPVGCRPFLQLPRFGRVRIDAGDDHRIRRVAGAPGRVAFGLLMDGTVDRVEVHQREVAGGLAACATWASIAASGSDVTKSPFQYHCIPDRFSASNMLCSAG